MKCSKCGKADPTKPTYAGVRALLLEHGPMTRQEIAEWWPPSQMRRVSGAISDMHRRTAVKQIHIASYKRKVEGQVDRIRAVYALGDKPDAPRLRKLTNSECIKRYRAKRKAERLVIEMAASSVFSWAANEARRAA